MTGRGGKQNICPFLCVGINNTRTRKISSLRKRCVVLMIFIHVYRRLGELLAGSEKFGLLVGPKNHLQISPWTKTKAQQSLLDFYQTPRLDHGCCSSFLLVSVVREFFSAPDFKTSSSQKDFRLGLETLCEG